MASRRQPTRKISSGAAAVTELHPDAGRQRTEIAPRWFELLTLAGIVSLGTVGSIGLLLAVTGRYTTVVAVGIGLPLAAVSLVVLHRGLPPGGVSRAAQAGAAAALVLAIGYGAFAGLTPSQNVVVGRDPGSYVTTGRWLARDGSLEVDARGKAFAGIRGLRFSGAAVYDIGKPFPPRDVPGEKGEIRESGQLQMQFNHLASVAMAAGYDVGGYRFMFRMPALLSAFGLLATYAVTVRLTRRPFVALLAPTLLAAGLPFLYVARNTYSESFASALLWGAVLVLVGVHDRPRIGVGLVGGLLLGALVCTRVDALLYVGMLFPLAAVSIGAASTPAVRRTRIQAWGATIVATGAVGAIGWYDLAERSGFYVRDLSAQLSQLRTALVGSAAASAVGLALWMGIAPLRTLAIRIRRPAAGAAAAAVGGALLFGWLIRPHVQTATTTLILPTVEALQRQAGLAVQPDRSYAEDSLRWMAWYLGAPALTAAIGGLTWAAWRSLRSRADATTITLLVLCLGGGTLYWYDPNITPDQLWASRRFVPAVFPSLAVWAAAAVAAVASIPRLERLWRARPTLGVAALGLSALVLLVPPALTTKPLRWQRIQPGYLKPILETCDALGPHAAVIVLGGYGGVTLPQSLRGWCGVPVAAEGSAVTPEKLPALAAQIEANGYRPYLVSPDITGLDGYRTPGGPATISTTAVHQRWMVEQTLDHPPTSYVPPNAAITLPTPFALHILEVMGAS